MRVRWIACGSGAPGSARLKLRCQGVLAACLRGRDVAWIDRTIFNIRAYVIFVAVTFADFSLRCSCSEQRVHSGLYDGLTWPDTGCASFD